MKFYFHAWQMSNSLTWFLNVQIENYADQRNQPIHFDNFILRGWSFDVDSISLNKHQRMWFSSSARQAVLQHFFFIGTFPLLLKRLCANPINYRIMHSYAVSTLTRSMATSTPASRSTTVTNKCPLSPPPSLSQILHTILDLTFGAPRGGWRNSFNVRLFLLSGWLPPFPVPS